MSTISGNITSDSKQNEVSPKSSPISCKRKEQSTSDPDEENPQNLTSGASIGDVHLDELLDQLIKPDVSHSSADGGSSEAVKHFEKAFILLLEKVPISDFESMIAMANGVFTCINRLRINYSPFYECVRNYIRCSSLLASTERFKEGSSLEELAAQYDSEKLCYEKAREAYEEISVHVSKLNEHIRLLRVRISALEESKRQRRPGHPLYNSKPASRTRSVVELEESEDKMRSALEALDEWKNKWHFQEVWQDFMNAKAALGL